MQGSVRRYLYCALMPTFKGRVCKEKNPLYCNKGFFLCMTIMQEGEAQRCLIGHECILQHDNNPKHTTKVKITSSAKDKRTRSPKKRLEP